MSAWPCNPPWRTRPDAPRSRRPPGFRAPLPSPCTRGAIQPLPACSGAPVPPRCLESHLLALTHTPFESPLAVQRLRFRERGRSSCLARSANGAAIPSPPRGATIPPPWRPRPLLGPHCPPDPTDGNLSARRRTLHAMSLGPHHPPGGSGYLLFEMRTQVCVSCAAPGAMRIAGDRRAICPPSAGPPTATPAALERHLSAPALAHRCATVATMPGKAAAGPRSVASGYQQPQQRAARRAAAGRVARSGRLRQPRSSVRRP